ncbi:MAG TPA: retroviral-like aspartic protease family protein [Sphingomicrobium sp.]|nr:retroviral-like aspartic protease family protein [Sphingomicrobium sp.]
MPRCSRLLVLALTCSAIFSTASAQAPQVRKPRAAPPGPSTMPPLTPAQIDNKLLIGGDDIKTRVEETRMTVEVQVNGHGPYHFVVDSGADTSAVGLRVARDLQLPLGTPVILNGMTDRNIVDRVKLATLTLGPSTIGNLEVPALREEDLGGDGMIGIDALIRQRLLMDFETRLIKVEDARRPAEHFTDEIVITGRLQHGQLILTQVRAGGQNIDAVIDTGSEITIGNLALRDRILSSSRTKDWTVSATGVTGKTVDLQLGWIRELRVGSITLRDLPVAFADVPPFKVFGLAGQPALLLGTDVLEAFRRVSLDFAARKVRFQLRRCGSDAVRISTAPTASLTSLSSNGNMEVCG